ncbi:hypothetical protein, partial [Limnoraphis robusta]
MKKTITLLVFLVLNIAVFSEEIEYKKFDESIRDIKAGHMKLQESMLDDSLEDRTKTILFNLGMATIYQAMKIMDPKDKRTTG